MHTRFKSLLTASILAAGFSIALPLQAQPVDKTGRFPAPHAQSAPAANPPAQPSRSVGQGNMMTHMDGMMEKRQNPTSGPYMDFERNLNENRRELDYQTRQLIRERERS